MHTYPDFRCPAEAMGLVAIVFSMLPIWIALGRGKWPIRAGIGVAAIGLLLPIRAYQPAIFFSIVGLVSVLFLSLFRFASSTSEVHRQRTRAPSALWRRIDVWLGVFGGIIAGWCLLLSAAMTFHSMGRLESVMVVAPPFSVILLISMKFGDRFRLGRQIVTRSESTDRSFQLRDPMFAVVLLAVLFAIDAYSIQTNPIHRWQFVLVAAGLLTLFVVATGIAFSTDRLHWKIAAIAAFAISLGFAMRWGTNAQKWLMQASAFSFLPSSPWRSMVSLFAGAGLMTTFCFASTGLFLDRQDASPDERPTRRVATILSSGLAIFFATCLIPIFIDMSRPLPERQSLAEDDGTYKRLESLTGPLLNLNPKEETLDALIKSGKQSTADSISLAYASIRRDGRRLFRAPDPLSDNTNPKSLGQNLNAFRSWARCMGNEAKMQTKSGQHDQAIQHWLDCIHVGHGLSRGGDASYTLTGIAIEGIGHDGMARSRNDLSIESIQTLLPNLIAIDKQREPWESIKTRCEVHMQNELTWQYRLSRCASMHLSAQEHVPSRTLLSPILEATEEALKRRNAMHRLLISEFAIRIFVDKHERLPKDLNELVTGLVSTVPINTAPIDPYTGRPLLYQLSDSGFLIYSVGIDGQDNGGRFGDITAMFTAGYDFDVDTSTRPSPPNIPASGGGIGGGMGGMGGGNF